MNLKNGKVFTSKSVGTGPSSCEKRIYRYAVSQNLRNTVRVKESAFFGSQKHAVDTKAGASYGNHCGINV